MTTGAQAEIYANYFIGRHLFLIGGGKTYSQLSAEALAQPKNTALAGQVETVFKGTTLRSMLLEAYGFWQLGQIALIAAIASFIARRPDADPVHLRVRAPAAHRPRGRDPAQASRPGSTSTPADRRHCAAGAHARPTGLPSADHRGREVSFAALRCQPSAPGPRSRRSVTVITAAGARADAKLCAAAFRTRLHFLKELTR